MSARVTRRLVGVAGAAAITVALAPVVAAPAFAAAPVQPDFDNSYFWNGGDTTSFPAVAGSLDQSVQTGTRIYVKFTGPVKVVQASSNPLPGMGAYDVSHSSYLVNVDTNDHVAGVTTSNPDGNDPDLLKFVPDTAPPDGIYELHVVALDATACPDITIGDLQRPSCSSYNDVVKHTGSAFSWRYDTTPPAPSVAAVNGGDPITAATIKHVTFHGTTSGDTKSMQVSIKGPGIVGIRPVGAVGDSVALSPFESDAADRTWSISDDLTDLNNGTYTVVANGTDFAGNKTVTGGTQTFTIAAHPSAPRSLKVRPGDASVSASWLAPTSTGGSPITAYEIVADDTTSTSDTPARSLLYCNGTDCPKSGKVTGLTNGHRYQVSVFAITDVGNGNPASVFATPKWRTTLTVLGRRHLAKGSSFGLTGRLSHTSDGSAVKNATVVVTPHFDGGGVGQSFKVTTDTFGTWYHRVAPTRDVTYVAHFAGDARNQPATGHRHVDVYVPSLPSTG